MISAAPSSREGKRIGDGRSEIATDHSSNYGGFVILAMRTISLDAALISSLGQVFRPTIYMKGARNNWLAALAPLGRFAQNKHSFKPSEILV